MTRQDAWISESQDGELTVNFYHTGTDGMVTCYGRPLQHCIASSELLEALRKLLRHADKLGGGCSVSADIHQAKQAMAKALGN